MLNDRNLLPIMCPACGHVTRKEVGRVKEASGMTCDRCASEWEFDHETLVKMIEHLGKSLDTIAGTFPILKKWP